MELWCEMNQRGHERHVTPAPHLGTPRPPAAVSPAQLWPPGGGRVAAGAHALWPPRRANTAPEWAGLGRGVSSR